MRRTAARRPGRARTRTRTALRSAPFAAPLVLFAAALLAVPPDGVPGAGRAYAGGPGRHGLRLAVTVNTRPGLGATRPGIRVGHPVMVAYHLVNAGEADLREVRIADPDVPAGAIRCPGAGPGGRLPFLRGLTSASCVARLAARPGGHIRRVTAAGWVEAPRLRPRATAWAGYRGVSGALALTEHVTVARRPPHRATVRYRVTNPGDRTVYGIRLHDPALHPAHLACPGSRTLPPGHALTCEAVVRRRPGRHTSHGLATGTDRTVTLGPTGHPVRPPLLHATASAHFTIPSPPPRRPRPPRPPAPPSPPGGGTGGGVGGATGGGAGGTAGGTSAGTAGGATGGSAGGAAGGAAGGVAGGSAGGGAGGATGGVPNPPPAPPGTVPGWPGILAHAPAAATPPAALVPASPPGVAGGGAGSGASGGAGGGAGNAGAAAGGGGATGGGAAGGASSGGGAVAGVGGGVTGGVGGGGGGAAGGASGGGAGGAVGGAGAAGGAGGGVGGGGAAGGAGAGALGAAAGGVGGPGGLGGAGAGGAVVGGAATGGAGSGGAVSGGAGAGGASSGGASSGTGGGRFERLALSARLVGRPAPAAGGVPFSAALLLLLLPGALMAIALGFRGVRRR
jgi:hypothetical protein